MQRDKNRRREPGKDGDTLFDHTQGGNVAVGGVHNFIGRKRDTEKLPRFLPHDVQAFGVSTTPPFPCNKNKHVCLNWRGITKAWYMKYNYYCYHRTV